MPTGTCLAARFLADHQDRFDAAADEAGVGTFTITKADFDAWLVRVEELSATPDETSDRDRRRGLVNARNDRRGQINSAAQWAKHGWPPYKIAVQGDHYAVRMVTPLLEALTVGMEQQASKVIKKRLNHPEMPEWFKEAFGEWLGEVSVEARAQVATELGEWLREFGRLHRKTQAYLADHPATPITRPTK